MAATTDFVIRAAARVRMRTGSPTCRSRRGAPGTRMCFPSRCCTPTTSTRRAARSGTNWRFGPGHRVVVVTEPVRRRRTRDRLLLVRARARARPRLHGPRRGVGVLPPSRPVGLWCRRRTDGARRAAAQGRGLRHRRAVGARRQPAGAPLLRAPGMVARPASPPTSTTTARSACPRSSTGRSCDDDRRAPDEARGVPRAPRSRSATALMFPPHDDESWERVATELGRVVVASRRGTATAASVTPPSSSSTRPCPAAVGSSPVP